MLRSTDTRGSTGITHNTDSSILFKLQKNKVHNEVSFDPETHPCVVAQFQMLNPPRAMLQGRGIKE